VLRQTSAAASNDSTDVNLRNSVYRPKFVGTRWIWSGQFGVIVDPTHEFIECGSGFIGPFDFPDLLSECESSEIPDKRSLVSKDAENLPGFSHGAKFTWPIAESGLRRSW
jgi:hypothetical protein